MDGLNDFSWDIEEEIKEKEETPTENKDQESQEEAGIEEGDSQEEEEKVDLTFSEVEGLQEVLDSNVEEDGEEVQQEEQESEGIEDEGEEDSKVEVSMVSSVNFLKEKGILEFELEEGEELDENTASDILEDSIEERAFSMLKDTMKELDPRIKDLVEYNSRGGDVDKLLSQWVKPQQSGLTPDLNIDEESDQEKIAKAILVEEGFDKDYIDNQLETLKDSGQLKKFSETKYKKWKEEYKTNQERILKDQQIQAENSKKREREFRDSINTFLEKEKEVKGLKLLKKDKRELSNYITDKAIELENGNKISQMQKDLYELTQDPESLIALSKILKSKLDFSEIAKMAETKVVKGIKQDIRRNKQTVPNKAKGGGQKPRRSLADLFE